MLLTLTDTEAERNRA